VFAYIDAVSARVSAKLIAERERRQRRAAALRADVVRAVLAGEPVDPVAAERALAHPPIFRPIPRLGDPTTPVAIVRQVQPEFSLCRSLGAFL
jgi:hypothetical protein